MRRTLFPAALALLAIGGSTLWGQGRDYRAERLVLDDNNGNTLVIQTPAGPITGGTLTVPDPGGAGTFLISNPAGGTQSVTGDFLPGTDNTYDLGSGASRWQDIFGSGNVSVGGQVQFVETGGGTDYVGFQAPAAVTANQIWTLPAADGTSGQALVTDGAGVLSWSTAGLGSVTHNATLSGNGTGASPLAINLGNSNTWTANQTFASPFLITSNSRIAMTNSDNNARDIRLQEPSGTGTQYIGLRAPSVANNGNYVLPAVMGSAGQVLSLAASNCIDSGTMQWITPGGGTVSTNATLLGDGSGGSPLGINPANGNTWTGLQQFNNAFTILGNGRLALTNNDNNGRDIRWQEPSGTGSQYVGLRAPNVPRNSNYVFPDTIGAPGDVLTVGTRNAFMDSATLVWATPGGGGTVTGDSTLIGNGSGGSPLGIDLAQSNVWTATISTFAGFLESRNEPFVLTNTDNSANEMRIQEASGNGSNYVAFRADTSITTNDVWILPSTAGTAGQVLGITAVNTPSNRFYTLNWTTPTAAAQYAYRNVSANTTLNGSDEIVGVNTSGGAITITLPAANSVSGGKFFIIHNESSPSGNTITVARSGTDLVDGGTSTAISGTLSANSGAIFYSNGNNAWFRVP